MSDEIEKKAEEYAKNNECDNHYSGFKAGYQAGYADAMVRKASCCETHETKLELAKAFIKAECYCEMDGDTPKHCKNCQFLGEL